MASEIKVDTIVNAGGDNDSGIDLATNDVVKVNIANAQAIKVTGTQTDIKVSASRELNILKDSGDDFLVLKSTAPDASNNNRTIRLVGDTVAFATGASSGTSSTERLSINSSGLNSMYLSSSDNNYVMNVNSQGSAGATGMYNLYFKADSAVFTGYHYYAKKDTTETFSMGDVVVLENGKATKCTTAHATNVVGIISGHPMGTGRWLSNNKDVYATEETAVEVASVGDSQDWNKIVTHYLTGFKVCDENGAISSGDLLCSAGRTGYLMKQDGTTITTETVGKSMDDVTFESDGTATGIYGFLYCG